MAMHNSDDHVRARATASARRILIVDDDRDTVELLEEMLGRLGHHVATAAAAPEALSAIASFQPDVVLLDIQLPDVSGLQLVQLLRSVLERPCRYVAVSGMASAQDMERGIAAGFDVYLTKPFRMHTLLTEIGHVNAGFHAPASCHRAK